MKDKQKEIDEITKRLEADKKKIMSEQDELLLKAKKTTEEIKGYNDAGEKIYKSFKGFFEKKIESEKIIKNIEIDTEE